MGRILGILSIVFADLIIPEIWKNQRYSVMEVEGAAFYTLRQICAARILMFAAVDLLMVTVFFCGIFLYGTDVGIQDDNGFPDSVQCLRLHLLWDVI